MGAHDSPNSADERQLVEAVRRLTKDPPGFFVVHPPCRGRPKKHGESQRAPARVPELALMNAVRGHATWILAPLQVMDDEPFRELAEVLRPGLVQGGRIGQDAGVREILVAMYDLSVEVADCDAGLREQAVAEVLLILDEELEQLSSVTILERFQTLLGDRIAKAAADPLVPVADWFRPTLVKTGHIGGDATRDEILEVLYDLARSNVDDADERYDAISDALLGLSDDLPVVGVDRRLDRFYSEIQDRISEMSNDRLRHAVDVMDRRHEHRAASNPPQDDDMKLVLHEAAEWLRVALIGEGHVQPGASVDEITFVLGALATSEVPFQDIDALDEAVRATLFEIGERVPELAVGSRLEYFWKEVEQCVLLVPREAMRVICRRVITCYIIEHVLRPAERDLARHVYYDHKASRGIPDYKRIASDTGLSRHALRTRAVRMFKQLSQAMDGVISANACNQAVAELFSSR